MKNPLFVKIGSVYLYEGKSSVRVAEALQMAVTIMRQMEGTGWIHFLTGEKSGHYQFYRGRDRRDFPPTKLGMKEQPQILKVNFP